MAQGQPIRRFGSDIPDKLYFRIGEVARICEVPAYVLRFWESEFTPLRPNKGGTGQRLYRRRDVETALRIKRLLYDEGYTIPGARQILKNEGKHKEPQLPLVGGAPLPANARDRLEVLRSDLANLLALLAAPPETSASTPGRRNIKSSRPRNSNPVQTITRPEYTGSPELTSLFDPPTPIRSGSAEDRSPQLDSAHNSESHNSESKDT